MSALCRISCIVSATWRGTVPQAIRVLPTSGTLKKDRLCITRGGGVNLRRERFVVGTFAF